MSKLSAFLHPVKTAVEDVYKRQAQDSAIKAAEASKRTTYEQACAESQANYDALNPHKGKE